MVRLLPLIVLMLWLSWSDRPVVAGASLDPMPLLTLLAAIVPSVAIMALWGRLLVRKYPFGRLPTRRFQVAMTGTRAVLVTWYAVCLFGLGFGEWVNALLAPLGPWHVRLPGVLIGTGPILLAWIGLAWASYPVERAVREGRLLDQLDLGLCVHAPPNLRDALVTHVRTQVLFLLAPILATILLRDAISLGFTLAGSRMGPATEGVVFLGSLALVMVASPELLIRILRARPMPASPLRARLEALADRLGLKYRDILIWHTSHGVGNAAVMGLLPRFRYVLLTDLLIETLDDEQIEAVFAHEAGHVRHRHLMWYVVFFAIFALAMAGPGELVWRQLAHLGVDRAGVPSDMVVFVGFAALFLAMFGMLSRLFERQADWFAARAVPAPRPAGAESFVSALVRVAEINHMPIEAAIASAPRHPVRALVARSIEATVHFLHPSVPARVEHLRAIARDSGQAERFDRRVATVMLAMIVVLTMLATWVGVGYLRQQQAAAPTITILDPVESYDVQ